MIFDNEHAAFEAIVQDFEMHYNNGPEMFASKCNFHKFLDTEARFNAKLLQVDFEKAKMAAIAWIKQNHTLVYTRLT